MPCACILQAADAEAKKYEVAQQAEQSSFVAGIADLESAVTAIQTYTDMSSAKAVYEEVTKQSCCTSLSVLFGLQQLHRCCFAMCTTGPSC